jgi:hypothetical protein
VLVCTLDAAFPMRVGDLKAYCAVDERRCKGDVYEANSGVFASGLSLLRIGVFNRMKPLSRECYKSTVIKVDVKLPFNAR